MPIGEFITEFIYPGAVTEGYDSVTAIRDVISRGPHSVFACFGCDGSVYEYLAHFGVSGVMRALPHTKLDYWTPHGWESGWCFRVPYDESRFLTDGIAHEQGCTLYLLRPELELSDFAKLLSPPGADAIACLELVLGEEDSILFIAADEYYSATTRRLQNCRSHATRWRFDPLGAGEFAVDRIFPGPRIGWDECFKNIWRILTAESQSTIACVAGMKVNGPQRLGADLTEELQRLPFRELEYCMMTGTEPACCFVLPSPVNSELVAALLTAGRAAIFAVPAEVTIDDFVRIENETHLTRSDAIVEWRRLLVGGSTSILTADKDAGWFEITRPLTP
jgi:hypothetical protein